MDSVLLILLPILFALIISIFSSKLFRKSKLLKWPNTIGFTIANLTIIGFSLLLGGLTGLILSLQINRIFFDYKVLEAALPNGIFMWYGFGPAPTPQFMNYWSYVQFACVIAFLWLTLLNFKSRKNG